MKTQEEIIARLSAGIYLKFNEKLNLSLDDCEQIMNFIMGEHKDMVIINEQSCNTFLSRGDTTSATKCQFCGGEQWEH